MPILLALLLCVRSEVGLDLKVVNGPAVLGAGLRGDCAVEVVNTGACALPSGEPVNLSYHWMAGDGAVAVFEGERTPLPLPLPPGAKTGVVLRLKAPGIPGRYRLRVDAVWERRFWFSELGGRPGPEVSVDIAPVRLGFGPGMPFWMAGGATRQTTVVVSNEGAVAIRKDDRVRVGYEFSPLCLGAAVPPDLPLPLPDDLRPGESATLEVPIRAPRHQGAYRFAWVAGDGGGTGVARVPARLPVVSQKVTTLFVAGMTLALLAAAVPPWRRKLAPFLPIVPWLWFIAAGGWKVLRVGEITSQWPDARMGLLAAASCALLGAPLLLLGWRARLWAFWALNLLVSVLMVADLAYYRYFGDFPSIATLAHGRQLGAVEASVPALLSAQALFLLADLPLIAILSWWGGRIPRPSRSRGLRFAAAGTALAACLVLIAVEVSRSKGAAAGVFRQRFQNAFLAAELGVVNYHLYDAGAWAWAEVRGRTLSKMERERVARRFNTTGEPAAAPGPYTGRARGRNFLLVQEESFESFALDATAGGVSVMPFLRKVRGDCLEFSSFFDETAHGRTSDAEFLLLTSLHPASGGSALFLHANDHFRTLAHIFRENGYSTLFAHPFDRRFWNRYAAYAGFGFDRLLFKEDFDPGRTIGWGLANAEFFEQSVRKLETLPRPFFALLVTLTDHHPYQDLPIPTDELPLGRLEGTLLGRYLKVCREKDRALEDLVRRIREAGLLEDTVIAVYGDHDAGLGWGKERFREAGLPSGSSLDLCERDRLPLLIHGPGIGGAVIAQAGGQMDLGPTVLDLAGLDPGRTPFLGRSLLAPGEGQAVFFDTSFRTDRLHFVRRGASGRPECWDLATRTETDIARCRPDFNRAEERLKISDAILRGDLVPGLLAAPPPAGR